MAISYTVDDGVVRTTVEGKIGYEEAREHIAKMVGDARIPEDMIEIYLVDPSVTPQLSSHEAGALGSQAVALLSRKRSARTVVVASTIVQYGVARMLGMRLMIANPHLDWREVRTTGEGEALVRQWKEELQALSRRDQTGSDAMAATTMARQT